MGTFLKKILELLEQDEFDHGTWMEQPSSDTLEQPSSDTFSSLCTEVVLPSANVGLPRHLTQIQCPGPAYVTHTGPLVRMLMEQDEQRKASSKRPAHTEPRRESREAGSEEETRVLSRGSSAAGSGKDPAGMAKAQSSLPPQSIFNRIIFARKPPSRVLPWSSPVCSSRKE